MIHITLQRPKPPRGVHYFCVDPVSRSDHEFAGLISYRVWAARDLELLFWAWAFCAAQENPTVTVHAYDLPLGLDEEPKSTPQAPTVDSNPPDKLTFMFKAFGGSQLQ